jgi:hypothetical protein
MNAIRLPCAGAPDAGVVKEIGSVVDRPRPIT